MNKGTLYLCATPIGNLEDMSYRAVRILKEVDLVAAEDTRQTRKLFDFYGINTPMTSYHKFNVRQKTSILADKLEMGLSIAVVSDAGLPGISDPGSELVAEAVAREITVVPVPGPSAFTTALVASGLRTEGFIFFGYLPSKASARKKLIKVTADEPRTLVFYEAPHRLLDTLEDMLNIYGDRNACVAREMTKKFEEFQRGRISSLLDYYKIKGVKGEITLIVSGAVNYIKSVPDIDELLTEVEGLMLQGAPKGEAIKKVAKKYNIPKRDLYKAVENK